LRLSNAEGTEAQTLSSNAANVGTATTEERWRFQRRAETVTAGGRPPERKPEEESVEVSKRER